MKQLIQQAPCIDKLAESVGVPVMTLQMYADGKRKANDEIVQRIKNELKRQELANEVRKKREKARRKRK